MTATPTTVARVLADDLTQRLDRNFSGLSTTIHKYTAGEVCADTVKGAAYVYLDDIDFVLRQIDRQPWLWSLIPVAEYWEQYHIAQMALRSDGLHLEI